MSLSSSERDESPPEIPADATVRRRRQWGCGILIALALATPVILFVGAYFAFVWSSDRMADEAIAKARAAGDPVNLADMEAFYPTSPEIEAATAHWLRAMTIVSDPAFNASTTGIPLFDGTRSGIGDEGLLPGDKPATTAFLDRYREALDEAHAARRAGSVARFPLKWQDGLGMLLHHAQNIRSVNRLLELDLEVKLAEGNVDGAVEDLLSMVATSESLTNEPILISQLVRIALLGTASKALERLLARHDLTDEQLARLQETFARQRYGDGLKRALQGEQYFLISLSQMNGPIGDPNVDRFRTLPFQGADMAKGLELWRNVIDASDEGLLDGLTATQQLEEEIESIADSPLDRIRYPMTVMLFPAIPNATKAFIRGEATARLAETAIACERYRVVDGELPADLYDLEPEYFPVVPVDPFDGQPLRYVTTESGATLYSIGMNQTDEGGLDDPDTGDIVFVLSEEKSPPEVAP